MGQMHMDFIHPAPSLTMVAAWARRHDIGPGVLPAEVPWNDVIHGQPTVAFATILAGIIITAKDLSSGQFYVWTRSMNLGLQSYDGRSWQQLLYRLNVSTPVYNHVSFAGQEQANRPSCGTNIDRFKIGIEHKHRFVHSLPPQQAKLYC
jgi:hypothetical protein